MSNAQRHRVLVKHLQTAAEAGLALRAAIEAADDLAVLLNETTVHHPLTGAANAALTAWSGIDAAKTEWEHRTVTP